MKESFTLPKHSDLSLWGLFLLLLLYACSPRVEQDAESQAKQAPPTPDIPGQTHTVAEIEAPAEEAYFDLIAKTSDCLGEDLWIGGKVESTNKVALSKAGAMTNQKVYEIKDLTAAGLNSNSYYMLWDSAGILKAVFDEEGVLHIQLQEGPIKLVPRAGHGPIMVAYQAPETDKPQSDADGNWLCQ